MPDTVKGTCLCGAVSITLAETPETFSACHCGMCRRWGGSPLMTVDPEAGVTIEGEDSVAVFASSEWAERGFCKRCGTHLFYHLKPADRYFVPLGLFGTSINPAFAVQIYVDHKPACYAFANQTEQMTEAQVLAMYAPPDPS